MGQVHFQVPIKGCGIPIVFQGTSLLTLDAKGRLLMPARHKEALVRACGAEMTITRHPDGCLVLYPRPVWEEKCKALCQLPNTARSFVRFVLGSAVDVACDSSGRLLIPVELRELCALTKEVTLVGMGEQFELWDREKWLAMTQEALAVDMNEVPFTF